MEPLELDRLKDLYDTGRVTQSELYARIGEYLPTAREVAQVLGHGPLMDGLIEWLGAAAVEGTFVFGGEQPATLLQVHDLARLRDGLITIREPGPEDQGRLHPMAPPQYPWAIRTKMFEPEEWIPRREQWGAGPWQEEPDLVEWRATPLPFPLLIKRGGMGALCGYIGVPNTHPLYGKTRVLGCNWTGPSDKEHRYPTGEPPEMYWWLGFDCGHGNEYQPLMEARSAWLSELAGNRWRLSPLASPEGYVTVEECRQRVEALAAVFHIATDRPDVVEVLLARGDLRF